MLEGIPGDQIAVTILSAALDHMVKVGKTARGDLGPADLAAVRNLRAVVMGQLPSLNGWTLVAFVRFATAFKAHAPLAPGELVAWQRALARPGYVESLSCQGVSNALLSLGTLADADDALAAVRGCTLSCSAATLAMMSPMQLPRRAMCWGRLRLGARSSCTATLLQSCCFKTVLRSPLAPWTADALLLSWYRGGCWVLQVLDRRLCEALLAHAAGMVGHPTDEPRHVANTLYGTALLKLRPSAAQVSSRHKLAGLASLPTTAPRRLALLVSLLAGHRASACLKCARPRLAHTPRMNIVLCAECCALSAVPCALPRNALRCALPHAGDRAVRGRVPPRGEDAV